MALNTLPPGAFADNAITSDKINLANNFAFTGTITGASDVVQVASASGGGTTTQVFNGCFTSTYKFYLVAASFNVGSSSVVTVRYQNSSNAELSSAVYYNAGENDSVANGSTSRASVGSWGATSITHGKAIIGTTEPSMKIFVFNPFASEKTLAHTTFHSQDNAGNFNSVNLSTTHDSGTSVTGIRFISDTGSFASRSEFRIYGFK